MIKQDRFYEVARECAKEWLNDTKAEVVSEDVSSLVDRVAALVRREVEGAEKRSLGWWFSGSARRDLAYREALLADHYYANEEESLYIYDATLAAIRAGERCL